ncbi:MAG: FAD-dependent thymidylate synthase [Clostridia bacterium]|nr:FAD-dependent thymidylate synthase [Clostridia bacterium]
MRSDVIAIKTYGSDEDIAKAAAISFGAKYTYNVDGIIKQLVTKKETTPLEFASIWFYIRCTLGCHRQFLQYRVSSRITRSFRRTKPIELENEDLIVLDTTEDEQIVINNSLENYELLYNKYKSRETAKKALCLFNLTEFYMLINLRNLIHLIEERTHQSAEDEIRKLAESMKNIVKMNFPILYKYALGEKNGYIQGR